MKLLNIQAAPDNWDNSTLTAVGVQRNGRALSPAYTSIKAADLPEPFLSVWHAAVEQFRSLGGGVWVAASVNVYKVVSDAGFKLRCDIHTSFPDLTTDRMALDLEAPEMVGFFDHFIDEASWPDPTHESPTPEE